MWNRKKRRQASRYGIGQQEYERVQEQARENACRIAWGGMMLALHDDFGFGQARLQKLAVSTLKHINDSLCASEMVDELKAKTGFDVDAPLREADMGMTFDATEVQDDGD